MFVLRSMYNHPERATAAEIAHHSRGEIDESGADRSLQGLAGQGLVAQGGDGRWRLTDAGRAAHEAA
jgi:DNA-binding IclR family transcriptional regulator